MTKSRARAELQEALLRYAPFAPNRHTQIHVLQESLSLEAEASDEDEVLVDDAQAA